MAVAIVSVDEWLQHLVFVGRRPTPYGPVDGLFFGQVSGIGDASGGNFSLNGNISAKTKEDWLYIMMGVTPRLNAVGVAQTVLVQTNSGPLINLPGFAARAQTLSVVKDMVQATNNAVTALPWDGPQPWTGMPHFGDKKADPTGVLQLVAVGFETNTNTVEYGVSVWGWLIRPSGFFRNVSPAVG